MRVGASGADYFWVFANKTAINHWYNSESGHSGVIQHYSPNNWFTKLLNGSTELVTESNKHSYTVDNDTYQTYFMRRIGNVVKIGSLPSSGHTVTWETKNTDTSTHPTGQYFGIGAYTGGAYTHHVSTYIEMRYWGSSNDITDETD